VYLPLPTDIIVDNLLAQLHSEMVRIVSACFRIRVRQNDCNCIVFYYCTEIFKVA